MAEISGKRNALGSQQFAKIAEIHILIVHVGLAFPVYLQQSAFHVPINRAFRIVKTLGKDFRKFVEFVVQAAKFSHVPRSHIDRNAADCKRILALYKSGDETLGHLIVVERCHIPRQRA